MRCVMALVFPVPAPARMQTGPRTASAADRCSGSSPLKISGSGTAVTGPSWQGRPTPRHHNRDTCEDMSKTIKNQPEDDQEPGVKEELETVDSCHQVAAWPRTRNPEECSL